MKIFIGFNHSCSLNYQYNYIKSQLAKKYEITNDINQADKIIFVGTCSCTEATVCNTINYINQVLKQKKETSQTFLTGCITREYKTVKMKIIQQWLKENIDYFVPLNQPNLLLQLISEEEFGHYDINEFGYVEFQNRKSATIYISNGCLNNCSFCKLTFQNYPLKSIDFEKLKYVIDYLDSKEIKKITLKGTNISQYGFDLYHQYMLPEVIEYIEHKKNIEQISLIGFGFKDAIKNNFEETLKNSRKVTFINGSLESGSDRLLQLIKKGFTSEEIIDFINNIRYQYYKQISLPIISGFPTETIEDVRKTLDILKELEPTSVQINRYCNSSFVESRKYEQLTPEEIQEHTRIYQKTLNKRNVSTTITGTSYIYNNNY